MPYDPAKTKSLLSIAQAYASNPLGEFTNELAVQLLDAEKEIAEANNRAGSAERTRNQLEEERNNLLSSLHKARTGTPGYAEMLAALTAIAKSPKGAAKVAATALEAVNGKAVT